MDDGHHEIVIIRRHSGHEEEHHGGAWKIAFADFMTAMMAFFLVLWIINATDKNTKTIIARYFNPVKLEDPARTKKGVLGDAKSEVSNKSDSGVKAGSASSDGQGTKGSPGEAGKSPPGQNSGLGDAPLSAANPAKPRPNLSESALFADPYASLDKIAGKFSEARFDRARVAEFSPIRQKTRAPNDPFKPIVLGSVDDVADGLPGTVQSASGDPVAASAPETAPAASPLLKRAGVSGPPAAAPLPLPTNDVSQRGQGAARSLLESPPAEEARGGFSKGRANPRPESGLAVARAAVLDAQEVRSELAADMKGNGAASQPGPEVEVRAARDELLINVTDKLNFSMFAIGSAEPQRRTVRVMEDIAHALKDRRGKIIVRGFTDARPYHSATYDNWRLSSARAQMAYYMLVRGGVPEKRFDRIEGFADRRLKAPNDPDAAANRRIEIVLKLDKP